MTRRLAISAPHDEPVLEPVADLDDDLFDESWEAPRRTNRLTVALVVALLVVGGFAGGVLVQKHHDSGLLAGAGTGARRAGGAGAGGTGNAGEAPVVEGTVRTVDGDAIEVTDDAGADVRVIVSPRATVTTSGLTGLAIGTHVSVTGSKADDGSVTATSVTARPGG